MAFLSFDRYFTKNCMHPCSLVEWEKRDVRIDGPDGEPVFEAKGVEFPKFWSERASTVVASKYFRQLNGTQETSVKSMINRVVQAITGCGFEDGYFDYDTATPFYDELTHILLHQYASFNSPVWFNVGIEDVPQTSACFLLAVEDSMEGILDWYKEEGLIFKDGSGAGINLSPLRGNGAPLSSGGKASGPMSFAKVADVNAGAIKSGGRTRRSAKMHILNVDHPDIFEFIWSKVIEEAKARALIAAGFSGGIEGDALRTVAFQNANHSVAVTDEFMEQAYMNDAGDWDGRDFIHEAALFYDMCNAAHATGDPGLQFMDTINEWHTCPASGKITTSNPCGEFVFLDNAACNLASINLMKFVRPDGAFDIAKFKHVVQVMITAQDILIDRSKYPTKKIAEVAKNFRPLGLGYGNLGAYLMSSGIPYDSDAGRDTAAAITALMTGEAYNQSARIAEVKGAFAGHAANSEPMRKVVKRHYDESTEFFGSGDITHTLAIGAAEALREACYRASCSTGFRNAQVTLLAPCGTISFMMDFDSTGIEPVIALESEKKLVGGGTMKHVVKCAKDYGIDVKDGIYSKVFQTALGNNPLSWQAHVKMVAAVQPFLSGAVSKTINMPSTAKIEDVKSAYIMAWQMGLKSISVYRDGCKTAQPVTATQGCGTCAGVTVPSGTCRVCTTCGESKECS